MIDSKSTLLHRDKQQANTWTNLEKVHLRIIVPVGLDELKPSHGPMLIKTTNEVKLLSHKRTLVEQSIYFIFLEFILVGASFCNTIYLNRHWDSDIHVK